MLAAFREFSKSWIVKGLMLLLIVSFAIWGIGDMFRGNPAQREVATVGGSAITVQQLEFMFQKSLPDARRQFGPELTDAQARQMGVLDQTLNLMIEESAFDQEAARLGIRVGQDVVMANIAAIPQFRDKDGNFRADQFQMALRKAGLTEQFFVESEKRDIARRLLIAGLSAGISVPKLVVDNMYQARGAKRILEIVSLRNDSMKNLPAPSESELKAYYEAHQNSFVAPEYRGITIARLSSEETVKEVAITKEEARKVYDANNSAYVLPQRRDLVQVVLQDEGKAKALSGLAIVQKDLSRAARSKGLTPIDMKKIDDKTVLPELYTTVFGLEEGDISQPVKSGLGWHVIQIKKIYEGGQQPFEEVEKSIRENLQQERVGDLVARNVNQLDDAIAAGTPLEEIADSLKLRLTRFPSVTNGGLDLAGKNVSEIPAKTAVFQAAYSQNEGEVSQVIEDGEGNYLVVRTDSVQPSHTRTYDEVKELVAKAFHEDQMAKAAADEANKIAEEMRGGKKATSYASHPGVSVRLSKPISLLGDMDKELVPTAIQHVFVMQKDDVVALSGPGRQYIIKLADIVPVNPKKPEPSRLKVVDDLKRALPLDLVDYYIGYVKQIFPVKINSELIDTLRRRDGE
jgi:peptidyl-prolyl cis-trans isomerase D